MLIGDYIAAPLYQTVWTFPVASDITNVFYMGGGGFKSPSYGRRKGSKIHFLPALRNISTGQAFIHMLRRSVNSPVLALVKQLEPSPFMVFIFRRLVVTAFILVVISLISFSTTYILPGDPVTSRYPDLSDEGIARMRVQMGLDQPLLIQYKNYLQSVFRGEFGYSLNTRQLVIEDIRLRLPVSFELTSYALIFAILVGVPSEIIAAVLAIRWGMTWYASSRFLSHRHPVFGQDSSAYISSSIYLGGLRRRLVCCRFLFSPRESYGHVDN